MMKFIKTRTCLQWLYLAAFAAIECILIQMGDYHIAVFYAALFAAAAYAGHRRSLPRN